jgi:uncharacterized membrane protein
MAEIGPLQIIAIGFADPQLDGSILESLADASDSGAIRVVDAIGVYKDEDGGIAAAQASDLTADEAVQYGAWIGALIGLGAGGEEGAELGAIAGAMAGLEEYEYGLDDESILEIAEMIPPGGAALLAVIEHTWAIPLRNAVVASSGIMLAQDFISPDALIAYGFLEA